MSELRLIVDRLNDEPFNKKLTLVSFDEHTNFELLQVLNDVFCHMDRRHGALDLRDEGDEVRSYRMLAFLQLLNYPLPSDHDTFRDALERGERQIVYPLLFWLLSNLPLHTKRAYLGRYLSPITLPSHVLSTDTSLANLHQHYVTHQTSFKTLHKQVEASRKTSCHPATLRADLVQLEEEKSQLKEKIAALKRKAAQEPGFNHLLAATSEFRHAQEEAQKLVERGHDQHMGLAVAEKRQRETYHVMTEMRAATAGTVTAEALFEQLHGRVTHHRHILTAVLPADMAEKKSLLAELDKEAKAPRKTEAEIGALDDTLYHLHKEIEHFQTIVNDAMRDASDDKLTLFRQHASAQSKKVQSKQEAVAAATVQDQAYQTQADALEVTLASVAGPKFMKRDEFKRYANELREKTAVYKHLKQLLASETAETVTLHRTEHILKGRAEDLQGFLTSLEAAEGVSGYHTTSESLAHVSEQSAATNVMKGQTLEEMGVVVSSIHHALKARKDTLAPLIQALRTQRTACLELERTHRDKKALYDQKAVGLETEQRQLETECDSFQEDCLSAERHFHALTCQLAIAQANAAQLADETSFENGQGVLLRDFKTFGALYRHKITTQESLATALRKQQKELNVKSTSLSGKHLHTQTPHRAMPQRQGFEAWLKVLQVKVNHVGPEQEDTLMSTSGRYGYQSQVDNQGLAIEAVNMNGANIMTMGEEAF